MNCSFASTPSGESCSGRLTGDSSLFIGRNCDLGIAEFLSNEQDVWTLPWKQRSLVDTPSDSRFKELTRGLYVYFKLHHYETCEKRKHNKLNATKDSIRE